MLILLRKAVNCRYRHKEITAIIMITKHLKYLIPGLFLLIGVLPMTAHALSIGQLKITSAYGQALNGKIELPAYTAQEIESLTVSLASQQDFDNAGLIWSSWFSQLTMTLRYDTDGTPYIALRSAAPINELTLSLIIAFDWKGGRTVKQFDSLISPSLPSATPADLPRISSEKANKGTATEQEFSLIEKNISNVNNVNVASEKNTGNTVPRHPKGELKDLGNGMFSYGPVLPGQTLSSIAEKFSARTNLSLQARMQVLFDLNPDAFTRNSFGSLKAGYTLQFSTAAVPGTRPMERSEEVQSNTSPGAQTSFNEQPPYEDNVDSTTQIGQIVRMQNQEDVPDEAQILQMQLQKTRVNVAEYRKTNNELRTKLTQLEQQLKTQADQLGIIEPESEPMPVNTSQLPASSNNLALPN